MANNEAPPRTFGERFAGVQRPVLPLDSVSNQFRIAVWNFLHAHFQSHSDLRQQYGPSLDLEKLLDRLARRKHWAVDELPEHDYKRIAVLKHWLLQTAKWWEVYELIEDAASMAATRIAVREGWPKACNRLLADQGSPYRFVGTALAPITSTDEIAAVANASGHAAPFDHAAVHIVKATAYFGRRPNPDYANTVKEALLGLESAVCVATGMRPGDFKSATAVLRDQFGVHGALMKAASALFGYGSDEGGVRHGKTDAASTVTGEDAYLVLIQASAWVNYVVQIATTKR